LATDLPFASTAAVAEPAEEQRAAGILFEEQIPDVSA